MSFHLAKCLDITPNGVLRPGFPQDYREYRRQPWFPALLETTSHIRFWVDWPSLQPSGAIPFGDPANPDHHKLTGLDEQIRLANQDELKTILMPYRYPRWLNGTDRMDAPFGRENLLYHPADRVALGTWRSWWQNQGNFDRVLALGRAMRALEYELPAEGHGPDSTWGRYVAALFDRYVAKADVHGRADYFEVVNEPNLQLWPQRSAAARASDPLGQFDVEGSELTVHRAVAEMMATMDHIARQHRPRVTCLAASTSDTDVITAARRSTLAVNSRWAQMADAFVPSLLDELDRIGFKAGPGWIWSYHNYNDAELGGDRVTALREALRGRWHGRTLDGGPMLFSTEGGIRLARMATRLRIATADIPRFAGPIRDEQAKVLASAFHLHRRSTGVGAGVALFTQYTLNADPNFDCGLREASGAERPAFPVWCGLEEFDPHDPLPSEWRPGKAPAPA